VDLVHDRWTIPSGRAACHAVEPRLGNHAPEAVEPRVDTRGLRGPAVRAALAVGWAPSPVELDVDRRVVDHREGVHAEPAVRGEGRRRLRAAAAAAAVATRRQRESKISRETDRSQRDDASYARIASRWMIGSPSSGANLLEMAPDDVGHLRPIPSRSSFGSTQQFLQLLSTRSGFRI
jgi:hypothetical protein